MTPNGSLLSIIIVTYYGADILYQCLNSVDKHLKQFPYEVILVSNGFDEEEKKKIVQEFTFLRWVDMGYNAGFSRANNVGMQRAQSDVFLLLNPDTIAIDNSIKRCYE
ncbi:MAG: glycosyltransferase, partial [Flavisolibacter sp.]|nr:glycosyltransferase [Flavisolibacter sp.]